MIGSISEPSIAVVAMVEPEMAEKTVPATTATTASRPGTCLIRRSIAAMTLIANPVWNSTSPIRMKSGMGVSEKLSTAALLLRMSWCRPASPPRNSTAPMRLMAMKENATGMPTNSRIVEPPSRSREAICQDITSPSSCPRNDTPPRHAAGTPSSRASTSFAGRLQKTWMAGTSPAMTQRNGSTWPELPNARSRRRNRVVARALFGRCQPLHAEAELEREQREGHGHRGEKPPFRQHQRLDGDRPVEEARGRDTQAIPHKDEAADEPDHVANPLQKPAEAARHGA